MQCTRRIYWRKVRTTRCKKTGDDERFHVSWYRFHDRSISRSVGTLVLQTLIEHGIRTLLHEHPLWTCKHTHRAWPLRRSRRHRPNPRRTHRRRGALLLPGGGGGGGRRDASPQRGAQTSRRDYPPTQTHRSLLVQLQRRYSWVGSACSARPQPGVASQAARLHSSSHSQRVNRHLFRYNPF